MGGGGGTEITTMVPGPKQKIHRHFVEPMIRHLGVPQADTVRTERSEDTRRDPRDPDKRSGTGR